MRCMNCFLVILVFTNQCYSLKINVEGSVSLGKDVMDSLSQFLGNINVRRSMLPVIDEDPITEIVRTGVLCRNNTFCMHLRKFIEELLTVLAMSVQRVLKESLNENFKQIAFEEQLNHYLEIVRNILERASLKVTEEKEIYYWTDTIKKICAEFQEMALIFLTEELQVDPKEIKNLKQKIIIATVLVEIKYQSKLCEEYNICVKSYKITKALNTLLERFKTTKDEKVRLFMKYFYEALFNTAFYTHICEKIAYELQVILNDMAYSNEVPTKDLLSNVQKIVSARLEAIETHKDEKLSPDSLLFHAVLSDMDHIYSVRKGDPFVNFFQNFYDWLVDDVKIDREIYRIVKDIEAELTDSDYSILNKLISEVRVFLEMTVEPGKQN